MSESRTDDHEERARPPQDVPTSEPSGDSKKDQEPNAWLREGADAPDAADIADPEEQQ